MRKHAPRRSPWAEEFSDSMYFLGQAIWTALAILLLLFAFGLIIIG